MFVPERTQEKLSLKKLSAFCFSWCCRETTDADKFLPLELCHDGETVASMSFIQTNTHPYTHTHSNMFFSNLSKHNCLMARFPHILFRKKLQLNHWMHSLSKVLCLYQFSLIDFYVVRTNVEYMTQIGSFSHRRVCVQFRQMCLRVSGNWKNFEMKFPLNGSYLFAPNLEQTNYDRKLFTN